jgi:hypothetical protein
LAKLALGRSAGAGQSGAFHSQGLNDLSQRPLCHSCNKMAFCGQASVLSMAKVGSLLEEQESTSCLIRTKVYRPKFVSILPVSAEAIRGDFSSQHYGLWS